MTKIRKPLLIFLLVFFVLSTVMALGITVASISPVAMAAVPTKVAHYFYDQLTEEGKSLYRAMEAMYANGALTSDFVLGNDYDLLENGHVTETQLEAYANGDTALLDAMGAARDAFYTDYAEIFYVDFEQLSFRVTQTADNHYHAYMGKGRSDTYWVKGFDNAQSVKSAITQYEIARDKVIAAAKAAKPTEEQNDLFGSDVATLYAQIREAHRQIALATVYRLESTCTPGNEGHVRTPYGVFVKGQSLCEGYSRAFKAVMDALGVPCVLINGGYRHTQTQTEEHMWTYVELGGAWYAVDMTFDDINLDDKGGRSPIAGMLGDPSGGEELNYYYSEEFFLKGEAIMNRNHAESPYKSGAMYPFTYPTLSQYNMGASEYTHGNIKVVQLPHGGDPNSKSTDLYISVLIDGKWCGQMEAYERGYYLLMRHEGYYLPEKMTPDVTFNGSDLVSNEQNPEAKYTQGVLWEYVYNPTAVDEDGDYIFAPIKDYEGYCVIEDESKATGMEFALTNIPPRTYDVNETDRDRIFEMFSFLGDTSMLIARSELVQIKWNNPYYQPAPHIVRSTPDHTGKIRVENTYEVKIEYDQLLKLKDGDSKLTFTVYGMRANGEILRGTNAVPASVISNINWYAGKYENGVFTNSYVTFTLTPSRLFAHDDILYMINFNLYGQNSNRQVNTIEYAAANGRGYCSLGVPGYNWRLYAQPQLVDNSDLSKNGWVDQNGNDLSQSKDRISLVVTTPTNNQDSTMNDLLANELEMSQQNKGADGKYGELGESAFQSFTYNIQLTVCKAIVVQTGEALKLSIGFPEGFTYESWMEGVEFKMYHFIHDEQDNIIGVEEIPVTVTPLGLIILVKSFSPFALVVVKGDAAALPSDRTAVIASSTGGTAVIENGNDSATMVTMGQGQTRTLKAKADAGYIIESVNIGDKIIVTNANEIALPFSYDDIAENNLIKVNYVPEIIKSAEEERGESITIQRGKNTTSVQEMKKATIKVTQESVELKSGERLELNATVQADVNASGVSYQWYKDGKAVKGQTSETLTINKVRVADSGEYTLHVTSSYDAGNITAISSVVNVSVQGPANGELSNVAVIFIIIGVSLAVFGIVMAVYFLVRRKKAK